MKVILKDLENQHGHMDNCHIAQFGELDILGGKGKIRLSSYASIQAFQAGMKPTMSRDVELSFADLSSFEPLWGEVATKLLTNSNSDFIGGTLGDA